VPRSERVRIPSHFRWGCRPRSLGRAALGCPATTRPEFVEGRSLSPTKFSRRSSAGQSSARWSSVDEIRPDKVPPHAQKGPGGATDQARRFHWRDTTTRNRIRAGGTVEIKPANRRFSRPFGTMVILRSVWSSVYRYDTFTIMYVRKPTYNGELAPDLFPGHPRRLPACPFRDRKQPWQRRSGQGRTRGTTSDKITPPGAAWSPSANDQSLTDAPTKYQ
jgi:hypothetical protein